MKSLIRSFTGYPAFCGIIPAAILIFCFSFISPVIAFGFDHSYRSYSETLEKYVSNGRVDYAGLKDDPDELDAFLAEAATVSREEFAGWSEARQLSFLINLYNAATLSLVADNYPVASIRNIKTGSGGPWEQPVVRIYNEAITLNSLENDIIRKNYDEPRVHFALVCAAKSCPGLLNRPYLPQSLNEQLDMQTREFLTDDGKNSVSAATKTARLSPVFDWYEEDFIKAEGSVAAFVNGYLKNSINNDYKLEYTEYDWSLNDRK